jgi:hypothetical protein
LFAGIFSLILAKDAGATVYYYTYTEGSTKHTICHSEEGSIQHDHEKDCKAGGKKQCSQILKGATSIGCTTMDDFDIDDYRYNQRYNLYDSVKNSAEAISSIRPANALAEAGVGAVTYAYNLPGQIAGLPPKRRH